MEDAKDGDKCKFDHDVAKYEKANLCPQFMHGHCRRLTKCKMNHDAVERLKRRKKVKRKKGEVQTDQRGRVGPLARPAPILAALQWSKRM